MKRAFSLPLWLLLGGVAACSFEVPLPAALQIGCAVDDDCPAALRCQPVANICVESVDVTGPSLVGNATITPAVVLRGGSAVLSFVVNEQLKLDPVVAIQDGRSTITLDEQASDSIAGRFTYLVTANGSETEGALYAISADVVDVFDNAATLPLGAMTFDFTGPQVLGATTFNAELFGLADTLSLSVTTSEAVRAGETVMTLVDAADASHDLVIIDDGGTSLAASLSITAEMADGIAEVFASFSDEHGNETVALPIGRVTIDVTPPTLAGAVIDSTQKSANSPIVVSFASTERLAVDPVVTMRCSTSTAQLDRDRSQLSDVFFTYTRAAIGTSFIDGACAIDVVLVDTAGNENVATLPVGFTLDTTAPTALPIDTPDAVVFRRAPTGDVGTGAKRFTVTGIAEPGATVRVYEVDGDVISDEPSSTAVADAATGAFTVVLAPIDRIAVAVDQVDAAGNASEKRIVRDVVWIATMFGKVPGSALENPHRLEERRIFDDALLLPGIRGEFGDAVARVDGARVQSSGAGTFEDITALSAAPNSEGLATAYDASRGTIVTFGGASCPCGANFNVRPCNQTTERGQRFSSRVPFDPENDGDPVPRAYGSLTARGARGGVLLFGGRTEAVEFNDVWSWNGTSWRQLCTDDACRASAPRARSHHGAAYDVVNDELIVFGGRAVRNPDTNAVEPDVFNDLWAFDGQRWRELCQDSACQASKPPARSGAAVVNSDDGLLIFGGDLVATSGEDVGVSLENDIANRFDNRLWRFSDGLFTELCTTGVCSFTRPPARSQSASTLRNDGVLVVHGGYSDTPRSTCDGGRDPVAILDDTWTFDGRRWRQIGLIDEDGDGEPPAIAGAALVRSASGLLIRMGGVREIPCATLGCARDGTSDVWGLQGNSWINLTAGQLPGRQERTMIAWDDDHSSTILIDSAPSSGGVTLHRLRHGVWRAAGVAQPTPVTDPALGSVDGSVVMYGGVRSGSATQTVFRINAAGNAFQQLCTGPPCIAPLRSFGSFIGQNPSGGSLLFGGENVVTNEVSNGAFTFSGTAFGPRITAPAALNLGGIAFDSTRGVLVIFGGEASVDFPKLPTDTHLEWNGTTFSTFTGTPRPHARRNAAMWYDEARRRITLTAGSFDGFFNTSCTNGLPECDDLWEFDGEQWRVPATIDFEGDGGPGRRDRAGGAFDRTLRRGVLTRGTRSNTALADTWLHRGGGDDRPAHVFFATFAQAGVDPKRITSLTITSVVGGDAEQDALPLAGAELLVWNVDHWQSIGTNTAPASAPAALDVTITGDDVRALQALPFGDAKELVFAVTTRGRNGGLVDYAQVATDAIAVLVNMR